MANNTEKPVSVSNIKAFKTQVDESLDACIKETDLDSRNLEFDSSGGGLGLADSCVDGETITLNESRALTVNANAFTPASATLYKTYSDNYSSGQFVSFNATMCLTGEWVCDYSGIIRPQAGFYISSTVMPDFTEIYSPYTIRWVSAPEASGYLGFSITSYVKRVLSWIYAPKITGLGLLSSGHALISVYTPEVQSLAAYTFMGCYQLVDVSFPKVSGLLGSWAFANCINLKRIELPLVTTIGIAAFNSCTTLSYVSLPMVSSISQSAFLGAASGINLSVYLGYSSVVLYPSTSTYHPFRSNTSTLSIYVPSSLYSSYKAHYLWGAGSSYSSNIYSF